MRAPLLVFRKFCFFGFLLGNRRSSKVGHRQVTSDMLENPPIPSWQWKREKEKTVQVPLFRVRSFHHATAINGFPHTKNPLFPPSHFHYFRKKYALPCLHLRTYSCYLLLRAKICAFNEGNLARDFPNFLKPKAQFFQKRLQKIFFSLGINKPPPINFPRFGHGK